MIFYADTIKGLFLFGAATMGALGVLWFIADLRLLLKQNDD